MSQSLESLMPEASASAAADSPLRDLVAFVAVGGSGVVVYVALSTFLTSLPLPWPQWVSATLSYALLILPVYMMHRRHSFRSQSPHRVALPRYVTVQASALVLASVFSWLFFAVFGVPSLFASALVIFLTSGVNFVVLRGWAFASGERA